tara:strand:- start:2540 stop:3769 length:1230 start_codon:yes stop_codon:yes gene_type:complete
MDTLKPQNLSFSFLAGKPLSLIITALFFMSLLLNFKKGLKKPCVKLPTLLLFMFMIWITITTYHAQFPASAWFKYDFSIKTMILASFIPFVIHKKNHLHTVITILTVAIAYYLLIGGWRSVTGGGAYGQSLVQTSAGDSGITETSTLSMVGVFTIPLIYYISKHSIFAQKISLFKPISILLIGSSILTVFGTYARTGLVGLGVLVAYSFKQSNKKMRYILIIPLIILFSLPFLPDEWSERMSTITNASEESSALGRIVVWRWTLDFASENPIYGGGFNAYMANKGVLHLYHDEQEVSVNYRENGKAFHNIFFEVLGEHGYIGLVLYCGIILVPLFLNRKLSKDITANFWAQDLAKTLNLCIIIYCVCGMFIGVAFSPWIYLFMGMTVALQNVVHYEKSTELTYSSAREH